MTKEEAIKSALNREFGSHYRVLTQPQKIALAQELVRLATENKVSLHRAARFLKKRIRPLPLADYTSSLPLGPG